MPSVMDGQSLREFATDAMRYWEPRRILYNLILAAIVAIYFVLLWPASRAAVQIDVALFVFLLAVLANVAYCAAYIPDIFAQVSGFREMWQRYRWILFLIGIAFAGTLTRFWALAIFGGHRH